jgi:hypothetical protein
MGLGSGTRKPPGGSRNACATAALSLALLCSCAPSVPVAAVGLQFSAVDDGRGGSYESRMPVTRSGRTMQAAVLRAPVAVRLPLGKSSTVLALECLAAPVFNVGDGMLLQAAVVDGGREQVVFGRGFDAGRRAQDRDWVPLSIPLKPCRSADCALILRLSAGAQGDLVADWLALADVRIVDSGGSTQPTIQDSK